MVKQIKDNEMQEVLDAPMAVVDFSATWCGPCQMLAPIVEEVAQEWEGRVAFYQADVDVNDKLAERFHVMSVPTLLMFKQGEKVAQIVGYQDKAALSHWIQKES